MQGLYVLLGQHIPLQPRLYRQKTTCVKEGGDFQSKVEQMIQIITGFQPLADTQTHVLLDSWYSAKAIWKAARQREFLVTTALKKNRSVRIADPSSPKGWWWQELPAYAQSLPKTAFVRCAWPRKAEHQVWVHVLSNSVKSLYRCQLVIIRQDMC